MTGILTITLNPTVDISSDADMVRPTFKIRTTNQKHHPGGGGINVARVIKELGGSAEALYLSGGATGVLLDECIARTALKTHRIQIGGATRIAFMVQDNRTGLEYRFVPEGPVVNANELEAAIAFVEQFEGDYIVVSGSLPPGLPDDTYSKIAMIAKEKNARFILDTSGEPLRDTLTSCDVFLVKPSLGELEKLTGGKLDEEGAKSAALQLVRAGNARNVAVSMGREGAFLANDQGVQRLPATHVKVQSAVGAGDSFVGAMVHALATGISMDLAFRLGIAAGAAAAMTSGTQLCRRKDVETLFSMDIAP